MIVPDLNLLLYAHFDSFREHGQSRAWWEDAVNGGREIGIAPVTLFGFIRIATHRRVFDSPLGIEDALAVTSAWLEQENVSLLVPGARYVDIAFGLLRSLGAAGNLTSDVQLAAHAIERQAEVCSNDTDFGRFPGLRWSNPLQP